MKIVFLGGFTYPVGMAGTKRVRYIIDYFKKQCYEIFVIIIHNNEYNIQEFGASGNFEGVSYRTVGDNLKLKLSLIFIIPQFIIENFILLYNQRKNNSKTFLYVYNGLNYENIIVILIAKLLGYKIVFDIVEDYSAGYEAKSFKSKMRIISNIYFEKLINIFSDAVIVISYHLQKKYTKLLNKGKPILNIPVSVKINEMKRNGGFGNVIRFVYSGTFGDKDGLPLLFTAFNNINRKYPNTELLLTGSGKKLKSVLDSINNNNIRYIGYMTDNDFYAFLNQPAVLCVIRTGSRFSNAGFPFKLAEFLSTGNPVIVSNVSDVSLYLDNRLDAFVVEPDRLNDLVNSMEYIINNPDKAFFIGKKGFEKAQKYFNNQINGKSLESFLLSIS